MNVYRFLAPAVVGLAVLALSPGQTLAQPTLRNTGVNAAGVPLALGSPDPHYLVVENGNANAVVVTNQAPGPYANSPGTALWVWQTASGSPGSVARTFRQTFDLTGFNPATAVFTGRYAADNSAIIRLNGVQVGAASPGFTAFTNFNISTNFVAGLNTLDFVATDVGAPGGLIVDQLVLTATAAGAAAPEPATIALFGIGVGAFAWRARRRR